MDKQPIKQAIINRIESSKTVNYSAWTLGLTHNPQERKQQHENEGKSTTYWKHWTASSLTDAQDIESYFINEKDMKGGTGGNLSGSRIVYIYIF